MSHQHVSRFVVEHDRKSCILSHQHSRFVVEHDRNKHVSCFVLTCIWQTFCPTHVHLTRLTFCFDMYLAKRRDPFTNKLVYNTFSFDIYLAKRSIFTKHGFVLAFTWRPVCRTTERHTCTTWASVSCRRVFQVVSPFHAGIRVMSTCTLHPCHVVFQVVSPFHLRATRVV